MQAARIEITNFHAFLRHDTFQAASLTKKVLAGPDGDLDAFKETPEQMVRRVCRTLGTKKNIVLINDEAHHCYQSASQSEEEALTADEKAEAKEAEKAARIWLNGLRAVAGKIGIRAIYDLSATPFFLRGSGFREGMRIPLNSPGHSALNSPPHSSVLAHPSEAAPAADAKRQVIP